MELQPTRILHYNLHVITAKPDRPYLLRWLRRTRKQLSVSGRLTELSLLLARTEGHSPDHWSTWLRSVLQNETVPTVDQLTTIDTLLAQPRKTPAQQSPEPLLFSFTP